MPTKEPETYTIGENCPIRIKITETSGASFGLAAYSIKIYDSEGTLKESADSTNDPDLFFYSGGILSYYWDVDSATYSAGTYYAVFTFTTDSTPAETYKKQVKLEVRDEPDLS